MFGDLNLLFQFFHIESTYNQGANQLWEKQPVVMSMRSC